MALHDLIGILGSALIVGSYLLLQIGRMRSDQGGLVATWSYQSRARLLFRVVKPAAAMRASAWLSSMPTGWSC